MQVGIWLDEYRSTRDRLSSIFLQMSSDAIWRNSLDEFGCRAHTLWFVWMMEDMRSGSASKKGMRRGLSSGDFLMNSTTVLVGMGLQFISLSFYMSIHQFIQFLPPQTCTCMNLSQIVLQVESTRRIWVGIFGFSRIPRHSNLEQNSQ